MQDELCSLCFASCDTLYNLIGDVRQSLAQIVPHFEIKAQSASEVACTNCLTKLKVYLELKSTLLQAEACVDFLTMKENENKNRKEVSRKEGLRLCRFCAKQVTDAYIPILKNQRALRLVTMMLRRCFPGLELGPMSDSMICFSCHNGLKASYNFFESLDVENRIKKENTVQEIEVNEWPRMKIMRFDSDGHACVDLNLVKEEDISNVTNEDLQDETINDFQIKEEPVDVEEPNSSLFESYARDVKVEQASNDSDGDKAGQSEITTKHENGLKRKATDTTLGDYIFPKCKSTMWNSDACRRISELTTGLTQWWLQCTKSEGLSSRDVEVEQASDSDGDKAGQSEVTTEHVNGSKRKAPDTALGDYLFTRRKSTLWNSEARRRISEVIPTGLTKRWRLRCTNSEGVSFFVTIPPQGN